MTPQELREKTGLDLDDEQFEALGHIYMNTDMDEDDFAAWLKASDEMRALDSLILIGELVNCLSKDVREQERLIDDLERMSEEQARRFTRFHTYNKA